MTKTIFEEMGFLKKWAALIYGLEIIFSPI